MSTFHVRQQLQEHPELIGILGQRRIKRLDHAVVQKIDRCLLDSWGDSHDRQFFVVSHDGKLLATAGASLLQTIIQTVLCSRRLRDIVGGVRSQDVAYIVKYDPGFIATPLNGGTSDIPCIMTICYPPKDTTVAQLIG